MKSYWFVCLSAVVLGGMLLSASAVGAPSGLALIPTTEVLDKGEISLEVESAGSGTPWSGGCDSFVLLQFGLGNGIEIGIDRSTSGCTEYWYNAKWLVNEESDSCPALAFGVQGINKNERSQPYLVATKSLKDTNFHAGPIRIERKTRWMVGADHPLTEKLAFLADYTSGDENMWSFGFELDLTESISLLAARAIGNSSDADNDYVVNLSWSISL